MSNQPVDQGRSRHRYTSSRPAARFSVTALPHDCVHEAAVVRNREENEGGHRQLTPGCRVPCARVIARQFSSRSFCLSLFSAVRPARRGTSRKLFRNDDILSTFTVAAVQNISAASLASVSKVNVVQLPRNPARALSSCCRRAM